MRYVVLSSTRCVALAFGLWACGESGGGGASNTGGQPAAGDDGVPGGTAPDTGGQGGEPGPGGTGGTAGSPVPGGSVGGAEPGGTRPDAGPLGGGGADGGGGDVGGQDRQDVGIDAEVDAAPVPCARDEVCPASSWCAPDGLCSPGCRLDAGSCAPDAQGRTTVCDEATRVCVPLVACCDGADACLVVRGDACEGSALEGSASCDRDPCGAVCLGDDDCPAARYCDPVDFRCALGCRLGDARACSGDQTCLESTRDCGFLDCEADADCPDAGQFCDRLGANATFTCREGCRNDASCGAGGRCAPDRTCVYLCDADADCPGDRFCDFAAGRCVPSCQSNDDCRADEVCDPFVLRCVQGCREDAFEPDETPDVARPVDLGPPGPDGFRRGTLEGQLCGENPDGVSVALDEGGRLFVRIDFDPAAGLRVRRIDPAAALAEREVELLIDRPPAVVTYPPLGVVTPATDVYFVFSLVGLGNSPWQVDASTAVGERACFPDEREGPDGAPNGATRLAREDELVVGTLCMADEDWFVERLQTDDGLDVALTVSSGGGDALVEGWKGSRLAPVLPAPDLATGAAQDVPGGRRATYSAPAELGQFSNEDWYFRVRPRVPGDTLDYRVEFLRTPAAGACGDDGGTEPNDAPGQAVDLDERAALADRGRFRTDVWQSVDLELALCAGDTDVFCVLTDADDLLEARVTSERSKRVRWVDNFGDPLTDFVASAPLAADAAVARIGRAPAGRFCAQVAGDSGPFALEVRRAAVAAFECAADALETDPVLGQRNDAPADATELPLPGGDPLHMVVDTGYLCDADGEDEDWYRFTRPAQPARVCITVTQFENSGGDVNLSLYDTPEAVDPEVDPNALVCETDADCASEDVFCLNGLCVGPSAASSTQRPFEMLDRFRSAPLEGTGERLLRVRRGQPPGDGVPYRLEVSLVLDTEVCDPDWQERDAPNDVPENPTVLGQGEAAVCDAWICREEWVNGDHYAVTVPAGEDRTVFLQYDGGEEGRLWMYATGPLVDPEDAFSGLIRSELPGGNAQCLNLRGGDVDHPVTVQVFADRIMGSKVDYTLQVVPTDLVRDPLGACVELGADDLDVCPPRAEWDELPGIGRLQPAGCYATFTLP